MMTDPILELVATLHKMGRDVETIARRVNKPVAWVNQVLNEQDMKLRVAKFTDDDGEMVDDGTVLWNDEYKSYAVERLTPIAFKTLELVMRDGNASTSSRVKAAELLLKYQPSLKENTKVDEEKNTYIQFNSSDLETLQRLQDESREN